jgi:predicted polyphosphate/ATP-dependent NAD kinase
MMDIAEINKRFKKSLAKDPSVLTCIVTGRSRPTNSQYLEEKAKVAGSKEEFIKHYICRDALTLLKAGKTVAEVREELGVEGTTLMVGDTFLKRALEINGK